MQPVEMIKALPNSQLLLEIYVVAMGEQSVELVFVDPVRSLDLAIELRRTRLDVDVFHAQVCNVQLDSNRFTSVSQSAPCPLSRLHLEWFA
jgi:hypothetical protein